MRKRTNWRCGVTKYSDLYEIVHQSLDFILLCVLNESDPEGSIMYQKVWSVQKFTVISPFP